MLEMLADTLAVHPPSPISCCVTMMMGKVSSVQQVTVQLQDRRGCSCLDAAACQPGAGGWGDMSAGAQPSRGPSVTKQVYGIPHDHGM